MQRDCWWYCFDWTCERFFSHTRILTWNLWICSHALYHCVMVTSGFHLWTISGIQIWCRWIGGSILLIGPVRDVPFCPHVRIWSGYLLDLLCCTPITIAIDDFLFSPLTISCIVTLVQRDCWWYCSDWTYEKFSFYLPHLDLKWCPLDL